MFPSLRPPRPVTRWVTSHRELRGPQQHPAALGARCASSWIEASYPAPRSAAISAELAIDDSCSTTADDSARRTFTRLTPSSARAFETCWMHAEQVMPSICSVVVVMSVRRNACGGITPAHSECSEGDLAGSSRRSPSGVPKMQIAESTTTSSGLRVYIRTATRRSTTSLAGDDTHHRPMRSSLLAARSKEPGHATGQRT